MFPLTDGTENAIKIHEQTIDVTIPLQCLVKDSKLILHNSSKVRSQYWPFCISLLNIFFLFIFIYFRAFLVFSLNYQVSMIRVSEKKNHYKLIIFTMKAVTG